MEQIVQLFSTKTFLRNYDSSHKNKTQKIIFYIGAVSENSPPEGGDGGGQLMGGWGSSGGEGTAVSIEKVLVIILPVLTMLAVFYIIVTLAIRLFQVD